MYSYHMDDIRDLKNREENLYFVNDMKVMFFATQYNFDTSFWLFKENLTQLLKSNYCH